VSGVTFLPEALHYPTLADLPLSPGNLIDLAFPGSKHVTRSHQFRVRAPPSLQRHPNRINWMNCSNCFQRLSCVTMYRTLVAPGTVVVATESRFSARPCRIAAGRWRCAATTVQRLHPYTAPDAHDETGQRILDPRRGESPVGVAGCAGCTGLAACSGFTAGRGICANAGAVAR
jgi:hypothetical protein